MFIKSDSGDLKGDEAAPQMVRGVGPLRLTTPRGRQPVTSQEPPLAREVLTLRRAGIGFTTEGRKVASSGVIHLCPASNWKRC